MHDIEYEGFDCYIMGKKLSVNTIVYEKVYEKIFNVDELLSVGRVRRQNQIKFYIRLCSKFSTPFYPKNECCRVFISV